MTALGPRLFRWHRFLWLRPAARHRLRLSNRQRHGIPPLLRLRSFRWGGLALLPLMTALATAGAAVSGAQAGSALVLPPTTLALRIGTEAALPTGAVVRFTAVVDDSRCPIDALCVWPGLLRAALTVGDGGGNAQNIEIDTMGLTAAAGGYVFHLVAVKPSRRAAVPLDPADYGIVVRAEPPAAIPTAPPGKAARSAAARKQAPGAAAAWAADEAWRSVITIADRARLDNLAATRAAAMSEARAAPDYAAIAGLVAAPTQAVDPGLLLGEWRCRTIKFGGLLPLTIYSTFDCYLWGQDGRWFIVKLTGSQRFAGLLYPSGVAGEFVYVGAEHYGYERAGAYGRDPERNHVGVLRVLREDHLVLELPKPLRESNHDMIELVRP